MGLHNEESEGQNILKGNVKRIVSGLLSAVTVLSAFLQPVGAYAAGPEPAAYEAEYPALEKVKGKLDADEIVAAEDYIVEIDSAEMIAEEEGILLFAEARQTARASGSATMVKGRKIYYPGNLGNYSTCYFTVNGKIAYCLESAKGSPDTGSYAAQIIDGNPNLQKALYYGG